MQRRTFIKNTALSAVAVSATGFIRFDGNRYVGDCETTTDILGPFYRPDSPLRNSLVIKDDIGEAIQLTGIIIHKDCVTPYKNAKVELWHCDGKGVYDNTSDEYRYRGTTFSDEKGNYSFDTILPVPYDTGGGNFRPAHFHMMITAEGYQPLVTQLYFTGDSYIAKDQSASSPTAKKRILQVQNLKNGTKKVLYNVGMSEVLAAEPASIDKLTGVYISEKDQNNKTEFFQKNNTLWMKNKLFGYNFDYIGNNTFQIPGVPSKMELTFHFEIMPSGSVKLTKTSLNDKGEKDIKVAVKEK